ncbi:retrovirus-related Pol polyprotein from transposon opus [Trichonephila clavipes]|nr:retrovirus-related Pol polyprotein from transposon opus [Trichonephila clavipes]
MAFLGRALKVDLKCLAEELGETVTEEMKVPALKKLIVASKEYEEVYAKELLHRIAEKIVIVEQMKQQVSWDIQQHFIDDWSRIVTVDDLTEKLDDYENARQYNQATKATLSQPYRNSYREKPSMCNRKCHTFDESVSTEEEEQEPTITEYDEENGNNTEKFKKQQQICDTLQEAWHLARRNKGGYVIENDILYHEELLGGNRIKQLVISEM